MPEIVGRLRTPRLSAAPSSPVVGEMYYDTGTNILYWWNGTTWISASGGGGGATLDLKYDGAWVAGTYNDGDIVIGADGVAYLCVVNGTTTAPVPWSGGGGGGAGTTDLRYAGNWVAGSYKDGDIVVGADGISYMCVRPTTAAPTPWASAQYPGKPTYGTTLPANPVDVQEAILVDSVTAPSWQWRFRYNANSTSAWKWEFIGGAPAPISFTGGPTVINTMTLIPATSAYYPSAAGATIVAPRDGIYNFSGTAVFDDNAAAVQNYVVSQPFIGSSIPPLARGEAVFSHVAYYIVAAFTDISWTSATAGQVMGVCVSSGASGTHRLVWMHGTITPRRVA